jgi:peroxiredoxin
MNLKTTTFVAALLAAITLLFPGATQAAETGKPAPAFTLKDHTGKTHNLSDFKGKTVVLEWINFDCPFVKKFYGPGEMQKLQKEATDKGVVWLSICSSAPGKQGHFAGDALTARIEKEKWAGTGYLIDESGTVGKAYGARTTPHMFVINPEGVLVYAGGIDNKKSTKSEDIAGAENYVRKALDEVLAGKPVTTATSEPYGCSVKY